MKKHAPILAIGACALLAFGVLSAAPAMADTTFNGHGDNQTDTYGYYYIISGGKFVNGQTVNGDNASGGTMRYLTDDPAWGGYALDVWHKDDWFTDNAGFALTMKNGGSTVYDNNGLEDGSYGDYYNGNGTHGSHGLYRGYSMSNNFDWIYAGYFKITSPTTIDTLIGYFDANGGAADTYPFNPFAAGLNYRMNIWSNVSGDLLPTNTGNFAGDVFTSDTAGGTFAVSDTGVVRVMPAPDNSTDPIYRLTYTLDTPITLQPGEYWFSHDAQVPVPEPAFFQMGALIGMSGLGMLKLRRRQA